MTSGNGTAMRISPSVSDDAVVRLRQWSTDRTYVFSEMLSGVIGTSGECAIRLDDKQVAPKHAQLMFDGELWWIHGTSQPIRQDGIVRSRFVLTAGSEVGIGSTTLIAESARMIQLRAFCQRLMGFGDHRLRAVDLALRAIRLARVRHSAIVLCGEGHLVPIAHALHAYTLGPTAPFVVSDQRRHDIGPTARDPRNVPEAMKALAAARGGSLCIRLSQLPGDLDKALQRIYEPDSDIQLFACMDPGQRARLFTGTIPIEVPPLALRKTELPRIIEEYVCEAVAKLGAPRSCFTESDYRWVIEHAARSLHEIQRATLRVAAVRSSDTIVNAATRLGMSQASLSRWLRHRSSSLPPRSRPTMETRTYDPLSSVSAPRARKQRIGDASD